MNFKELKRWVRISPLRNSKLYHALRFELKKGDCDRVIKCFLGDDVTHSRKKGILRNMRKAMIKYHWDFCEYFLFDYEGTTHNERLKYVSEYDKNVFCDQVNDAKRAEIFYSKWDTYVTFKEFFKREAILVSNLTDTASDEVNAFLMKHNDFIVKPLTSACGRGIQIIRSDNTEDSKRMLMDVLQESDASYIVEELIDQVDEMSAFHPQSVNTVRIPTFNLKGDIRIVRPFMRIGCGDSVVDNAGSGGVFALIDVNSGVATAASDEYNNTYVVHPDSQKQIVGFTIPRWDEAVETAKKLAGIVPDVKYVGWDLALTRNGWVLVEGNDKGQFVFQYPTHDGFKDELDSLKTLMC